MGKLSEVIRTDKRVVEMLSEATGQDDTLWNLAHNIDFEPIFTCLSPFSAMTCRTFLVFLMARQRGIISIALVRPISPITPLMVRYLRARSGE